MFRRICTFIIIFLISNLSYSDDKNQLLLHKEQKKINALELYDIYDNKFLNKKIANRKNAPKRICDK